MKQTAGRNQLGGFADKFAELNDDVLFGEVWSRTDKLSLRDRSIITVVSIVAKGLTTDALKHHIANAKNNGVTKEEIVEILTHIAFYVGWPNVWATWPFVKEVYGEDSTGMNPMFGLGVENKAFEKYFIGKSYLNTLNNEGVPIHNVTFEPGCRNNWHIHHGSTGGGQILLCTDGEGWYQEWNQPARKLMPGDVVYIAPGVKHWHGAAKDSWFAHLSLAVPGTDCSNEWLEEVDDNHYLAL